MLLRTREASLELQEGRVLCLTDAQGAVVRATRGQLWVTVDGDPRDHVLATGDQLVVGSGGCTLVSAVAGDAALVATSPRKPTLAAALRNLATRFQRIVLHRHPAAVLRAV